MLEIHLQSTQETELQLKCFIITGGTTLKFKELDHFSVVRNGNVQFPSEMRCSHVFPCVCNLHKRTFDFFFASNWTLCAIIYASKRKTSASQDAMTHSGYISELYIDA